MQTSIVAVKAAYMSHIALSRPKLAMNSLKVKTLNRGLTKVLTCNCTCSCTTHMPWDVVGTTVEVSIVLGEHIDVVDEETVEVAARSNLCEPGVHRHRFVEDRQRIALCEYNNI